MTRAYCILAAAATLINGSTLAPWLARPDTAPVPTSRARPPAALPTAFSVEAEKESDGLFRVTGLANGRPVRFIVDTGATVTVLTARDAAALALSPGPAQGSATLRTAGGSAATTWHSLDRLDIAGVHLEQLDIVVVDSGLDHSLLGQDVLSQLGTVTMTGERLEIRRPRA